MSDCLEPLKKILEYEPDLAFARRAKIIFTNLEIKGNENILDIGCGRGFYLKTFREIWPNLKLTGIDLNQKYLDQAKIYLRDKNVTLIKADATSLPFKDETFDRVIATEILEHIPEDQKAIEEMYRVLKPGGIALITVPNKNYPFCWDPLNWFLEKVFKKHIPSDIWWLSGIWADHVRLYGDKELKNKLKTAGFKIKKIWYSTHYCFPFSHFLLYGIGKNLVERGLCKSFNRFEKKRKKIFLNSLILWPVKKIDELNKRVTLNTNSVNLIVLVSK